VRVGGEKEERGNTLGLQGGKGDDFISSQRASHRWEEKKERKKKFEPIKEKT